MAECKEEDYNEVESYMNKQFSDLFKEKENIESEQFSVN